MEFLRKYGVQTTIQFPVVKAGSDDLAATGDWTPASGDVKISKDAGAVANTTNLPTAVTGTGSVMWTLTLTATEMQAGTISIQIVDSATKAIKDTVLLVSTRMSGQIGANEGIYIITVDDATFTPTATAVEANATSPTTTNEATADHFNGRLLLWTSGAAQGELTQITDYELANSKMKLTFDAVVSTIVDGDTAVII